MQIKTIQCYELNFLHKSQDADGIRVGTDLSSLGSSAGRGETAPLSAFVAVLPKSLSFNKPTSENIQAVMTVDLKGSLAS